ncbi:thioredoxin family protein [Raoultibacter massiliensis]|uniref:Thioredoxin family protein n=1 Tax=Raoultibacter massiliensis TaxID=1852371 RepID=A0ABV1JFZ9_9ACTN|nr:thioredoxin family protein [Raoultibacter massiliensis]
MASATILTDENIVEFIEGQEKPVLVCFYSSEEDTQYQFDKVIEELADTQDKVAIGKIDAWKNPESARFYNAKWFPTSIMFSNGEIKDYCVGEDYAEQVMERFANFF